MAPWMYVLCWYTAASVATLGALGLDKRAAEAGRWRIPERRLHAWSLAGGWPGGLGAIWLLRHKNRKPGFVGVTILIAVLHIAGWVGFLYSRHG